MSISGELIDTYDCYELRVVLDNINTVLYLVQIITRLYELSN